MILTLIRSTTTEARRFVARAHCIIGADAAKLPRKASNLRSRNLEEKLFLGHELCKNAAAGPAQGQGDAAGEWGAEASAQGS